MTELQLRANGKVFAGWTEVSISRSIEQLASSFSLTVSELWTERGETIPILEGAACTIKAGTRQIIDGYVDSSIISYSAGAHALTVQGRSKLGDLVDCSAVVAGGQFKDQTLEDIAELICAPFGISVISERLGGTAFRRFAVQEGESCLEVIERAAKAEGAMIISNDAGSLLITSGVTLKSPTILKRGDNILTGRRQGSWADRFSTYTIKSQNSGSSKWNGRHASRVVGTSDDDAITRSRPLNIIAEAQVDNAGAKTRANWERNTRSGRSQRLAYTVRGWEDGDGIWTPNTTVAVQDDFFGVDDDLLLVSALLTKGAGGEIAELELTRPEAFNVLATPPSKPRKGKFW